MFRFYISLVILWAVILVSLAADDLLKGNVLNNADKAFDGNPGTYFSATTYNYGWAGVTSSPG